MNSLPNRTNEQEPQTPQEQTASTVETKRKRRCSSALENGGQLLDTHEAAIYVGFSESYLRKARAKGWRGSSRTPGPVFARISGVGVRYKRVDLDAFLSGLPTFRTVAEEAAAKRAAEAQTLRGARKWSAQIAAEKLNGGA
jgi:hypothetical protein